MLTYTDIIAQLPNTTLPESVSEAHGMLCGFICAGRQNKAVGWLETVAGCFEPMDNPSEQLRQPLIHVYTQTLNCLSHMDLSFQLFLPKDEMPLDQRARALGLWCHGFMTALGLAEFDFFDPPTDDIDDTLHLIVEVAQIDYEGLSISVERDEAAFLHVAEEIRVSVLNFYADVIRTATTEREGERVVH